MAITQAHLTLDDRYTAETGRVFLTGVQALVRVALEQRRRDRKRGLKTAGFISGYRGSPLGGLDGALWAAKAHLDAHDIRFMPAVNEELAATAVIGSQQAAIYDDASQDGVFAIWYAKGPGADRAGDALKHANSLGSAPLGGVLCVIGDDPGAVSSSLAHQCEQLLMGWMMPLLFPASIHEYLEFGLKGIAMSRYSGCYTGFKAVSEVVESAASVAVAPTRLEIREPDDFEIPPGGLGIRWPDMQLPQEARLQNLKLPAAQAFARANGIDRTVLDPPGAKLGIAAAGKAYQDLMQALDDLGIDDARACDLGLRVYKIGLVWPLEPEGARGFARGLQRILVVEEKRAFIETQLKELLYNVAADSRPAIHGKRDAAGGPLLPTTGELSPETVARVLARWLGDDALDGRARAHLAFLDKKAREAAFTPLAQRPPIFCSGCPHNISTRLPEGSRALVGTGCHLIAAFMERRTDMFIQMGGEGAHWVGQAPFCKTDHIFQNLGDGTYVHSGYMAIRQALAAETNITFKILYNDAVAMTGGQPFEGGVTVPEMTRQVHAEGVRRIAVVTDDRDKYGSFGGFAPGVTFHERGEMDALQRALRDWPGVSVLIYDQVCATEKRRRQRRGTYPEAPARVFINAAVCEDCGDCVEQSSCVSVIRVETDLGPKRAIDQSACNEDLSCNDGFCPSFVTVEGVRLKTRAVDDGDPARDLPLPSPPAIDGTLGVLIAGIGGTGVVTLGQILAIAAHMDGLGASALDFTGLAQKGGGVLTHVRIAADPDGVKVPRLPTGGANLLIVADMVMAAAPEALSRVHPEHCRAVVNARLAPIAANVLDPDSRLDAKAFRKTIADAVGAAATSFLDAAGIAEKLAGDAVMANIFLVGYAFQRGLLPLRLNSILHAIRLNGAAVEANTLCFAWGRVAAAEPERLEAIVGALDLDPDPPPPPLEEVIRTRVDMLRAYQDDAYVARYLALVEAARDAEKTALPGGEALTRAVALSFYRLLAYKDEYEVARLFTDGAFARSLSERFEGRPRLTFHMAPPGLSAADAGGRPEKRVFGPWLMPALGLLARMKGLRGTAFDPFGRTAERRMERHLIDEYESRMQAFFQHFRRQHYDLALTLARLPMEIRGFGPVKAAAIRRMREKQTELVSGPGGDHVPRAQAAE